MYIIYIILLIEGLFSYLFVSNGNNIALLENFSFFYLAINSFMIIFAINKAIKGNKKYFNILLLAYFVRFLLMIFDLYGRSIWTLPASGTDTEMFHKTAEYFALYDYEQNGYSLFVGLIYKLFGVMRPIAQYVNLLLSISTIIISKKIFDLLELDEKIKTYGVLIVAFIPNYLMESVILLREAIMIYLLALSLLYFIRWWKNNKTINFILSILLVLISSTFHSGAVANAIGYILFFIFHNNSKRIAMINFKTVISALVITVGIIFVFNNYYDLFFGKFGNIDDVTDITTRTYYAEAGGAGYYVAGAEESSLLGLLTSTPIRAFMFITSPLPWRWRGLNDLIAFIFSALFYIASIYYALKVLKTKHNNKGIIVLCLLLAFFSSVIFAWGTSNAGTALRHRDKFLIDYVVMFTVAINAFEKKSREIRLE